MSLHKSKILPFPHFFAIEPISSGFDDPDFLLAAQHVVDSIIPETLWLEMKSGWGAEHLFSELEKQLPLFKVTEITDTSKGFSITYLCPAEYTHRARRYVLDILRKWLIPPKQVEITGGISLMFKFVEDPKRKFLMARDFIAIRNREEGLLIKKNLNDLIAQLREKLPCEFLRHSDNSVHPLFLPRNEEEMIRGLIVLTNQIKYVRDLPQVSIHFDKQTDTNLNFTVIIARLLKGNLEPLRNILEKSKLKMDIDDVRVMGYLKKQKYPKEAALLRITLGKRPFFRPDYSVDILKARQKIVSSITQCIGKFRDFNGGMILKQDESMKLLRGELISLNQKEELLLENYFYSLRPAIMQTVHDPAVLKTHFNLLRSVLLSDEKSHMEQELKDKFYFAFLSSTASGYKQAVLDAIRPLEISSRNLTISFFEYERTFLLGFILRIESTPIASQLQDAIEKTFKEWKDRFFSPVK